MLIVNEKFIEKLKNNDEESFQRFYNEYYKLVYHIAYSYTYNKEDSEDIVSEVFMRIMRSIANYENKGKTKEWVCQITRNVSNNFVTRDKEKDVMRDEVVISNAKSENNSHHDMISLFEENLDTDTVSIMILRFIYDYKFKDIALFLNMSIGKVQGLYYNGLEKLRKVCG